MILKNIMLKKMPYTEEYMLLWCARTGKNKTKQTKREKTNEKENQIHSYLSLKGGGGGGGGVDFWEEE